MRKPLILLIAAALLAAMLISGCKKHNDVIIDVDPVNTEQSLPTAESTGDAVSPTEPAITDGAETDTPADTPTAVPFVTNTPDAEQPTAVPTSLPSAVPTSAAVETDPPATAITVPTIAPTAAPTNAPGQLNYGVFDSCCFIGNSVFEGLHNYGVIKNGTWYTKVGLNILTVYNTPVIGGTVPVIDELNSGSYSGVLLMFGQNECGWPDLSNFIRKYEQLLSDVWAKQPQAKLFIMGITPVSKAVSDKGENGVTNANINTINEGLAALASRTENAYFVSVPSQFYTSDGSLQPDASTDGVHLNVNYMRLWADHICRIVDGVL